MTHLAAVKLSFGGTNQITIKLKVHSRASFQPLHHPGDIA
jgi:hypothetical protein